MPDPGTQILSDAQRQVAELNRSSFRSNSDLAGSSTVKFDLYNNQLPMAELIHRSGTSAKILLFGANPISFVDSSGKDLTWISRLSQTKDGCFDPSMPIRGGLFACLPELGGAAPGGVHGFSRVSNYRVIGTNITENGSEVSINFELNNGDFEDREKLGSWQNSLFQISQTIKLGADYLETIVTVSNNNMDGELTIRPFFHDYYACHAHETGIHGLQGLTSLSKIGDSDNRTQAKPGEYAGRSVEGVVGLGKAGWGPNGFNQLREIEELFLGALQNGRQIEIIDNSSQRITLITTDGLPDLQVWNPFVVKSRNMADFGNGEYATMLCAEAGSNQAIQIPAGSHHNFSRRIESKAAKASELDAENL